MSCHGKQRFKTEKAARGVMRRMRQSVVDWSRLQVFRCKQHKCWHIGNRPLTPDTLFILDGDTEQAIGNDSVAHQGD